MKIAAARALAELARQDVPDDVAAAYQGNRPKFGPNYIIPVPFDPRLISAIPVAVARAAMDTGVARRPILDLDKYANELSARRDPIASTLQRIYDRVRRQPKRVVFAEGEEEQVMRAAVSYVNQKLGTAILVGRDEVIKENARAAGIDIGRPGIEIINARLSRRNGIYADFLYERMQRKGFLFRDCQRLINNDRNHFAACMVALGDADAMVTGVTRNYSTALEDVRRVIDAKPGHRVIGVSIVLCARPHRARRRHRDPRDADRGADRRHRRGSRGFARRMGYEPRVAMLAYSTFGHPAGERSERVQEAVKILDKRRVDFEYDGEMAADVALNPRLMQQYPFCRLSGPANVLVMPAFHSASISTKMLQELGGSTVIGPLLVGLTSRCRSSRSTPRTPTSSTWRRSRPTPRARDAVIRPLAEQWQFWAVLSAVFAALTAIFAKVGVSDVSSDYATLVRTAVILFVAALVVRLTGAWQPPSTVPLRTWTFLVLSGLATGASWLCYFRALKLGEASRVAPIDKLSVVLVAVFATLFLGERPSAVNWLGIALIAAGAVLVAWKA